MVELYRDSGLEVYEKVHYSHEEYIREVEQICSWYRRTNTRLLDVGCSGGLHALEFARRGFSVTGLDIEPSAILRAERRNKNQMLRAEFRVIDIEKDDISRLGEFDLIYSIGNVMSHVRKERIFNALRNIRACLDGSGVFLFDVFIIGTSFREEVYENDLNIHWKRKLDKKTGRISMEGTFPQFGISQYFKVWGYSVEEICGILDSSGFGHVDFSDKLDFSSFTTGTGNVVSLNFRATIKGVA